MNSSHAIQSPETAPEVTGSPGNPPDKSYRPSPGERRAIVASVLAAVDVAATVAALLVVSWLAGLISVSIRAAPAEWQGVTAAVAILMAIFWLAGLYTGRGPSPFERLRLRTLGVVAFCALEFGLQRPTVPGGFLQIGLMLPALLALGHYAELAARYWLERKGLWSERAIIIGDNRSAELLIVELLARPLLGVRPVAAVSPTIDKTQVAPGGSLAGVPVVANIDALAEPIDVAIAIGPASLAAFDLLNRRSGKIKSVLLLSGGPIGESLWKSTRALGQAVGVEVSADERLDQSPIIKRAVDLLLVSLVVVPAGLIVALAALAVKLVDPGPIFYAQRRIGQQGRPIDVLKVRSMYQDAEQRLEQHLSRNPEARQEWARNFKLRNDPRVLPVVGAIIRKSSIDELPQLWNVLRGDMSLVGPRPFPEYHANGFDKEFQVLRLSVPPGLTGLWQVGPRSDGDLETQKAEDLFYIRNRSLWLDLYIMLQTLPAVVIGRGAR